MMIVMVVNVKGNQCERKKMLTKTLQNDDVNIY